MPRGGAPLTRRTEPRASGKRTVDTGENDVRLLTVAVPPLARTYRRAKRREIDAGLFSYGFQHGFRAARHQEIAESEAPSPRRIDNR